MRNRTLIFFIDSHWEKTFSQSYLVKGQWSEFGSFGQAVRHTLCKKSTIIKQLIDYLTDTDHNTITFSNPNNKILKVSLDMSLSSQ